MALRSRRRARDPFHHPTSEDFNYDLMLEAMAICRREVSAFKAACGLRNPIYREVEALMEQLDAVARLSRVAGAEELVRRDELSGRLISTRAPGCLLNSRGATRTASIHRSASIFGRCAGWPSSALPHKSASCLRAIGDTMTSASSYCVSFAKER